MVGRGGKHKLIILYKKEETSRSFGFNIKCGYLTVVLRYFCKQAFLSGPLSCVI